MEFSTKTQENIGYYVYALVDPRDGKVFYIGKGKGNRVFAHANGAMESDAESEKIETIKAIQKAGKEVGHYIVRHGLDEDTAFEIESALIDFLTYPQFNLETVMTNIQSGHHQWDRGIKTVNEIEQMYATEPLEIKEGDYLLCVNLNKSYKPGKDIYEITRGDWIVGKEARKKITHVLGIYRGIVRGVYKPEVWEEFTDEKGIKKVKFVGKELPDCPYMNKDTRGVVKINPYGRPVYATSANNIIEDKRGKKSCL